MIVSCIVLHVVLVAETVMTPPSKGTKEGGEQGEEGHYIPILSYPIPIGTDGRAE